MDTMQYRIILAVSALCAGMILVNVQLNHTNLRKSQHLNDLQVQINRAQSLQNSMQNLLGRVQQEGQTDRALQELLVKHRFVQTPATTGSAK